MVVGVTEGFKKELEINGVGFRCQKNGKDVVMNLGFSHQVTVSDTDDVKLEVPAPNKIIVTGIDKQKVGQYASEIRGKRPLSNTTSVIPAALAFSAIIRPTFLAASTFPP